MNEKITTTAEQTEYEDATGLIIFAESINKIRRLSLLMFVFDKMTTVFILDLSQPRPNLTLKIRNPLQNLPETVIQNKNIAFLLCFLIIFSIAFTGSSTHDEFVATHYDLYVYSATNYKTYIKPQLKIHDWNHYAKVKLVGCIPLNEILAFDEPIRYAKELEYLLLRYVYDPLYQRNAGAKWSSILNCQTFTRSAIQYLGAQFPEEVEVISDCIPALFDIYINTSLMAAVTTQEIHEKISV